jgi:hypothetical protein
LINFEFGDILFSHYANAPNRVLLINTGTEPGFHPERDEEKK